MMQQQTCVVEYHNVRIAAGDLLPLPGHSGILRVIPKQDCNAKITVGEWVYTVLEQEVTLPINAELQVCDGILAADLIYEVVLSF